jgi:hypothetical protein
MGDCKTHRFCIVFYVLFIFSGHIYKGIKISFSYNKVRVGSVQQTKGTTYTVSKVHVHESFNYTQLSNDLALVTLSGALQPGPTVVAADLPGPCLLPMGHSATVAGWGRTATHQNRIVGF